LASKRRSIWRGERKKVRKQVLFDNQSYLIEVQNFALSPFFTSDISTLLVLSLVSLLFSNNGCY